MDDLPHLQREDTDFAPFGVHLGYIFYKNMGIIQQTASKIPQDTKTYYCWLCIIIYIHILIIYIYIEIHIVIIYLIIYPFGLYVAKVSWKHTSFTMIDASSPSSLSTVGFRSLSGKHHAGGDMGRSSRANGHIGRYSMAVVKTWRGKNSVPKLWTYHQIWIALPWHPDFNAIKMTKLENAQPPKSGTTWCDLRKMSVTHRMKEHKSGDNIQAEPTADGNNTCCVWNIEGLHSRNTAWHGRWW